ncbi:hypothetical protein EDC01DRAFT_626512 [Geopyxis carbonaria]|nr:hypothetical protein EDC01DRAFT_626512 [Geopyxis carbonaria]
MAHHYPPYTQPGIAIVNAVPGHPLPYHHIPLPPHPPAVGYSPAPSPTDYFASTHYRSPAPSPLHPPPSPHHFPPAPYTPHSRRSSHHTPVHTPGAYHTHTPAPHYHPPAPPAPAPHHPDERINAWRVNVDPAAPPPPEAPPAADAASYYSCDASDCESDDYVLARAPTPPPRLRSYATAPPTPTANVVYSSRRTRGPRRRDVEYVYADEAWSGDERGWSSRRRERERERERDVRERERERDRDRDRYARGSRRSGRSRVSPAIEAQINGLSTTLENVLGDKYAVDILSRTGLSVPRLAK